MPIEIIARNEIPAFKKLEAAEYLDVNEKGIMTMLAYWKWLGQPGSHYEPKKGLRL